MKQISILCIAIVCLTLASCTTPSNVGKSYNFSLIKLVVNVAAYKSTASSSEAGGDIAQKSTVNSEGSENIDIPLARDGAEGAVTNFIHNKYHMSMVPFKVNVSVWKSTALSSSGMLVDQESTVNADGAVSLGTESLSSVVTDAVTK